MPVPAAWQDPGDTRLPFDPHQIWSRWASDLRTVVLPCRHFLPEEKPTEIAEHVQRPSAGAAYMANVCETIFPFSTTKVSVPSGISLPTLQVM